MKFKVGDKWIIKTKVTEWYGYDKTKVLTKKTINMGDIFILIECDVLPGSDFINFCRIRRIKDNFVFGLYTFVPSTFFNIFPTIVKANRKLLL